MSVFVRVFAASLIALCVGGCHRSFACSDDVQCSFEGAQGFCEAAGFCSFEDDACPSGRRWGAHASEALANACVAVEEPGTTTTDETTSTAASTTVSASTSASTLTSASSTSSGDSTSEQGNESESVSTYDDPSGLGPCDPPPSSEPLLIEEDGAVVERIRIEADGPGIEVRNASDVVIRDVEILHDNGPGLLFSAAHRLTIENVIIVHTGAPKLGPHGAGGQANIEGRDSSDVTIDHVRVTRGSSGIELENTPGLHLSFIEGHDVRGPGLAAFIGVASTDGVLIEDFSMINPLDTGRPRTHVRIENSSDVTIRRGLLDGSNAEFGYGVLVTHVPGQTSGAVIEDVDTLRMTNGGFSTFPNGIDVVFRRTRSRDHICEILSVPIDDCSNPGPNGGCIPGSNGTQWSASPSSSNVRVEDSTYFELCESATTVWPQDVVEVGRGDLVEADFEPREPIVVAPCWD